jgi:pimeloyl-ACP methyl ester carboxylesterase
VSLRDEIAIEANGLRFRALAEGPPGGEPVLLLHGFPEGAESWGPQLIALAGAGFRVVAPDLRGYGGTDAPEGEEGYRIQPLMDDVRGLLDTLGWERAHLAGHDWGALVGWPFVSQHPDRVLTWSALSVGHPTAFREAAATDTDQQQRSSYIGLFRQPGKAEQVLAADGFRRLRAMYRAGPHPDAVPDSVVDGYVAGFARPGRMTAALNYYRAALPEIPRLMGSVTTPTLLIWGNQDPAVGRLGTEKTAAMVEGPYRLVELDGAGHWLQFERPDELADELVAHLHSKAQD